MPKRDASPKSLLAERSALTREVVRLRSSEQLLREENDELLENQRLLEDARHDFADLYDGASQPLLSLSEQGRIRSANLAAAELCERERSWLIGRFFPLLFREEHRSRVCACLDASTGIQTCGAQLVLPAETLLPVQLSRRFSARRRGVAHLALLDLRTVLPMLASTDVAPACAARRILLVEDHHDTAEAMQEVLERHGYRVVAADSVQAAVGVDLAQVDAIVSDIVLPDGKGTDLVRQLKRARPVPAIAFSGLARSADIESAKQAGFDLYFTKPVDFPGLLAALGTMLAVGTEHRSSNPARAGARQD
jgi:CheY-like chemotaxis protein